MNKATLGVMHNPYKDNTASQLEYTTVLCKEFLKNFSEYERGNEG